MKNFSGSELDSPHMNIENTENSLALSPALSGK